MSNTVDINKGIYQSLVRFFDVNIKKVKYNTTCYGFVKTVLGDNTYTVTINGQDFTISGTTMPISEYFVGNIVMIEVVNNDFSFKYIKCLRPY